MELTERYARWLAWGTRISIVLLVGAYAAYVFGLLAPHVPIDQLQSLWQLPASQFLERTGVRPGLAWTTLILHGDMLVLAAIALVTSVSIACLAAVLPIFLRGGERAFAIMCALQIAVLVLAASGFLSA
jgi:hypothetical protein